MPQTPRHKPQRFHFTQASLRRFLNAPPSRTGATESDDQPNPHRSYAYDATTPGLALCRTDTGAASFYLYRRVKRRPQRVLIGKFPQTTIEQARKAAAKLNGEIARGGDPMADRRAARAEMTLGQLFDAWLENHAKAHNRTWKVEEWRFDNYLDSWRTRQLSAVTQGAVAALHTRTGAEAGPYAANRLLSLISSLFGHAKQLGYTGGNPAAGVKRFREQSRERFLQADELARFFDALDDAPSEKARDALKLLLLTGARKRNVLRMRWDDVNLDAGTWTIPASEFKTGTAMTVYLSAAALAVLRERRKRTLGEWVFPGRGGHGHMVWLEETWEWVLSRAKLADLRIHDLRRTLGSWQAASGASLPIIGKSLGHKSQAATAIYARLNLDPVKQSVDAATAAMLATVKVKKGG